MAEFSRQTLSELATQIGQDLKTSLGIAGPITRRPTVKLIADEWAAAVHLIYGALDFLSRQLFVATMSEAALVREASTYGLVPDEAAFATGTTRATGVDTTLIPLGTVFVREDDSALFESTANATITGGIADVPLIAVLAGTAGNTDAAETLNLQTPIVGVNDATTVQAPGISGGTEAQTVESFRAEVIEFFQSSPAGGSDDDYVTWAKQVAGVTRVWVFGNTPALGQVKVLFVRDDDAPGSIFPDAGEILTVQSEIDGERPTTADVDVDAPNNLVLPFTLSITPDTTENRAAVEAELDDMVRTLAEAGDGAGRGTIFLSQVYAAIGRAPLTDFTVTAPVGDKVPALFDLITRGTVTWT